MTPEKLMMSPTLERLFHLSQTLPCDVNKPDDLKTALVTCSVDLIDALDNGRIKFYRDKDAAVLYGLLVVAVDFGMGGRLRESFKPVGRH
jgi:hypothetical protein